MILHGKDSGASYRVVEEALSLLLGNEDRNSGKQW